MKCLTYKQPAGKRDLPRSFSPDNRSGSGIRASIARAARHPDSRRILLDSVTTSLPGALPHTHCHTPKGSPDSFHAAINRPTPAR